MARADKWMEPYGNPIDDISKMPIKGDPVTAMAGGSVASGLIGAMGSSSAADSAASANQASLDQQNAMFKQTQANLQPYMGSGNAAVNRLNFLLGLGGNDTTSPSATPLSYSDWAAQQGGTNPAPNGPYYGGLTGYFPQLGGYINNGQLVTEFNNKPAPSQTDYQNYVNQFNASHPATPANTSGSVPGGSFGSLLQPFTAQQFTQYLDPSYQWQLSQGNQALQNSQAAKDGVLSGAALKDLIGYNQGMASTNWQNAFNNYNTSQNNVFSRLNSLASLGENAASNNGNNATSFANTMGNTYSNIGQANAAGSMGVANALSGGINNGLGYYQLNQMLNKTNAPSYNLDTPIGG